MKKAQLKTIEQNDNVSLYSICFDGSNISEYEQLSGYVMDLQRFDELLKQAQMNGSITIEKNMIVGIDNKVFEL